MKQKYIISYILLILALCSTGCAIFRYTVIPQERKGPHDGALILVDQRIPEYIEFVAIQNNKEWTFQAYFYNKDLQPKPTSGSGYLRISLPDGSKKAVNLWTTEPNVWSGRIGHLENKIELGDIKTFSALLTVSNGSRKEHFSFNYPY